MSPDSEIAADVAATTSRRGCAEERRFSGWRTGLLVVGVVVGGFAGLVGLVLAAPAGL